MALGFVLEKLVTKSDEYIDVRGNKVNLKASDVWKYGETSSQSDRYSRSELNSMVPGGVRMVPIIYWNSSTK